MHDRYRWHFCSLFLLIACVSLGVWIFSLGFLLSRVELPDKSHCPGHEAGESGCYPSLPPTFRRAVVIVVDALKYEFLVTKADLPANATKTYENKVPEVGQWVTQYPKNAALFKFIADPPTTTMQRIKGLTTGSLPTFVDFSDNFAAASIQEDNIVAKFIEMGKAITFMGDDTWTHLFTNTFSTSYPYPSFDVRDLDTVDQGVMEHLLTEIKRNTSPLLIAHFLGVDHCGHRYGRDHPEMARKLREVNAMIHSVSRAIGEDTVLLVLGDHGMTKTGDHGGDSPDEVEAGLFVYSRLPFIDANLLQPSVAQVDFVPTLSLLLGHPIPFSNLGKIIPAFFSSATNATASRLYEALKINANQVMAFLQRYSASSSDLKGDVYNRLLSLFATTETEGNLQNYMTFFENTFHACQAVWAKFDDRLMGVGVTIVGSTVAGALFVFVMVSGGAWLKDSFALFSVAISAVHFLSMFSNSFQVHEDITVSYILQIFNCLHFFQSAYQRSRPSWQAVVRWIALMLLIRCLEFVRRCREEHADCTVSPLAVNLESLTDERIITARRIMGMTIPVAMFGWFFLRLQRIRRPSELTHFLPFLFILAFVFVIALKFVPSKSPDGEFLSGLALYAAVGALYLVLFSFPVFIQRCQPRMQSSAGDISDRGRRLSNHAIEPQEIFELRDSIQLSSKLFALPMVLFISFLLPDTWALVCVAVVVLARFHFADATPVVKMVVWAFLAWQLFFLSGHQTAFPTLHWISAFTGVGADGTGAQWAKVLLMTMETFSGQILAAIAIPSLMSVGGDVYWLQNPLLFWRRLWLNCLGFLLWHSSKLFFIMLNAAVNRRHLMVWKIFAPRFIFEAGSYAVTGLFVLLSYLYAARAFSATLQAVADLQVPVEQYISKRTKELPDRVSRKRR